MEPEKKELTQKEKRSIYFKKYYAEHKAAQKEANTKWRAKNPDKIKGYRDKEEAKEYQRNWKANNKDKLRVSWRKSNQRAKEARALQKKNQSSEPLSQ